MKRGIESAIVLGAGLSGRAAEALLQSEDVDVVVVDERTHDGDAVERLCRERLFELGVVSPGFSLQHPWLVALREAGVAYCSELELGWSRYAGRTVAVTGSNGKSSTVKWLADGLKKCGFEVGLGGNYGVPASTLARTHSRADWWVLEVSSFQLETVVDFTPEVGVLLNVRPNHLDRHGDMETYVRTKERIFGSKGNALKRAVLPWEWRDLYAATLDGVEDVAWVGTGIEADYRAQEGRVWCGERLVLDVRGSYFDAPHWMASSAVAVAAVMEAVGVGREAFEEAAQQFEGLAHRFERVECVNGVEFINDSKATNLAAMAAAVASCRGGVRLLAGGVLKESDLSFVKEILAEKVLRLYVFGSAASIMEREWGREMACASFGSMKDAFDEACCEALEGEVVLLSPGCASFDQFKSFEERGDRFKTLVSRWSEGR